MFQIYRVFCSQQFNKIKLEALRFSFGVNANTMHVFWESSSHPLVISWFGDLGE